MKPIRLSLLLCALLAGFVGSAQAADDAAKKMQQMQRKFSQDKAALEGQLREASSKLDERSKQAEEATGKSNALASKLRASEAETKRLNAALEEGRKQLAESQAANEKLTAEGAGLSKRLSKQTQAMDLCTEKNAKLYQYGNEMLQHYESKGTWTSLMQGEPLTRIKRVQIENLMEDYREKLDEQKL